MTFSSKVKDELLNVETIKPCCILAECYGLLLFGRGFSAGEVYISTEIKMLRSDIKSLLSVLRKIRVMFQSRHPVKLKSASEINRIA